MSEESFIVSSTTPVSLDVGVAQHGERVSVDPEGKEASRLIRDGRLVRLVEKKPPTKAELDKRAKELDIKGRSSMNVEDLTAAIAAAEKENV